MRNDLGLAMLTLRPDMKPESDYRVEQDSDTGDPRLVWFASEDARPSDQEITDHVAPLGVAAKLAALEVEADHRLASLPYDGHTFDVSKGKEDLVHKWFSGSQAYGDLWGGGTWIHSNTPYEITTATQCASWAMTLFALAAQVHNARDAHELALRALTTQSAIDSYDTTSNWP